MKLEKSQVFFLLLFLAAFFGWLVAIKESSGARYWRERAGREIARAERAEDRAEALRGDVARCNREQLVMRSELLQSMRHELEAQRAVAEGSQSLLNCISRGGRFERTVRRLYPALPEELDASSEDGLDP